MSQEHDPKLSRAGTELQTRELIAMVRRCPERADKAHPERTMYTVAVKWKSGYALQAFFAIDEERLRLTIESGAEVDREELLLNTVATSFSELFETRKREKLTI